MNLVIRDGLKYFHYCTCPTQSQINDRTRNLKSLARPLYVCYDVYEIKDIPLVTLIEWFLQNFPGVDVYAVINSFLWTMIIALLVLALVRPLLLRPLAQAGP